MAARRGPAVLTPAVDIDARRRAHAIVSTELALADDVELRRLVRSGSKPVVGWGRSHVVEVAGIPVFVKRLLLTDLEMSRPYSTRNLFRLPSYYQYGVGSAGFGAFRELAVHVRTTGGVLEGSTESFPLLHHHRVMAKDPTERGQHALGEAYLQHWNRSNRIADYMAAREAAIHEVWLFLEHFPNVMGSWLHDRLDRVPDVVAAMLSAAEWLRQRDVVHFDLHFGNVVGDGTTFCAADFGLALDAGFRLTPSEQSFLARHRSYDAATVVMSAADPLAERYLSLGPEARARADAALGLEAVPVNSRRSWINALLALVERAEAVGSAPELAVSPEYVELVIRYRPVVLAMARFIVALSTSPRKDAHYDDDEMRELLIACGVTM